MFGSVGQESQRAQISKFIRKHLQRAHREQRNGPGPVKEVCPVGWCPFYGGQSSCGWLCGLDGWGRPLRALELGKDLCGQVG